MNRGWRCVQCRGVISQSLQRGQESSLERRPVIPGSSVILADFQCKHADYRLHLARTSVPFRGCFGVNFSLSLKDNGLLHAVVFNGLSCILPSSE